MSLGNAGQEAFGQSNGDIQRAVDQFSRHLMDVIMEQDQLVRIGCVEVRRLDLPGKDVAIYPFSTHSCGTCIEYRLCDTFFCLILFFHISQLHYLPSATWAAYSLDKDSLSLKEAKFDGLVKW